MKAMLYADWINFRQSLKSLLFTIVLFALCGFLWSGPYFFAMIIVMLSIMTPITLCSADKAYGWDRLSLSLPILRRDAVGSKFVLSLFASLALLAVSAVLLAVYTAINPGEGFWTTAATLLACEAASLFLMGVILVTSMKWGIEKARYIMLSCVWIPILLVFLVRKVGVPMPDLRWIDAMNGAALCLCSLALIAAGLVFYFLCGLLAIRFYRKKEL